MTRLPRHDDAPILIVDDDLDIREALVETLEDMGFPVVTAAHGSEALALLRHTPVLPSLILLDLMMPVMDGYRFWEELRRDPELASIPVAIITAGHGVDRSRLGQGIHILPKPINVPRLLTVVRGLRATSASGS
jgi:CheY-like chemotaxis protein